MRCLSDSGIGYDTGYARVPLVCQSDIYDLCYGSPTARPNADMGYRACQNALTRTDDAAGNVGCGTGATVGKLYGIERADKSGFGWHAVRLGKLTIAAVVCVNALGDIYSSKSGEKIAGLRSADRTGYTDTVESFCQTQPDNLFTGNTTIGAIITNASFDKAQLCKIANMAAQGYARCIRPVGTMADSDTIYAAGTGGIKADINLVGMLSAEVMAAAIGNAIETSRISEEEFMANIVRL
ncbi:MAG: P1 family peptidase [Spirochaetales bacterium]|nr:P1 family peptidase [Spirochaetales bacterium]